MSWWLWLCIGGTVVWIAIVGYVVIHNRWPWQR